MNELCNPFSIAPFVSEALIEVVKSSLSEGVKMEPQKYQKIRDLYKIFLLVLELIFANRLIDILEQNNVLPVCTIKRVSQKLCFSRRGKLYLKF